jgi:hypothetical protein
VSDPFRSPIETALHHAEALERENAALKRELAALRRTYASSAPCGAPRFSPEPPAYATLRLLCLAAGGALFLLSALFFHAVRLRGQVTPRHTTVIAAPAEPSVRDAVTEQAPAWSTTPIGASIEGFESAPATDSGALSFSRAFELQAASAIQSADRRRVCSVGSNLIFTLGERRLLVVLGKAGNIVQVEIY